MPHYKVVLEIELEAETPLEAAKTLVEWLKDGSNHIYMVQDDDTHELFSVDLDEDDEDAVLPTKLNDYQPLIDTVIEF
jgi:hypothetical protein